MYADFAPTCGTADLIQNLSLAEDHGIPSIEVFFRKSGSAKVAKSGGSKSHGASPEVLAALEQLKPDLSFKVLLNFLLS